MIIIKADASKLVSYPSGTGAALGAQQLSTVISLQDRPVQQPGGSGNNLPSRRAHQIIDRMQLASPQQFNPRAFYDGRHNLYSQRDLGTIKAVRYEPVACPFYVDPPCSSP